MKKQLILLACMTAVPYLLNSAGRWADSTESKKRQSGMTDALLSNNDPMHARINIPGQYHHQRESTFTADVPDAGNPGSNAQLSKTLLERKRTKVKSSIKANWVLDTLTSQYEGALVYVDKDNPELKAVIYTDNAGNMLMRLEQEGRFHEIRVKKVEFHTSVSIKPQRPSFNKLMKSTIALKNIYIKEEVSHLWKGGRYVPV